MKFLAFFFTACLLTAQSYAQPTSTVNIAPPPAWGGVIDKFAKEGVPEPADNTDAKLATEAYSEQERADRAAKGDKAAKAGAAPTPVKSASGAVPSAAADKPGKPAQEEELSKTIKGAVKDVVNPFKEVMGELTVEKKQDGDPVARLGADGQVQPPTSSNASPGQPRTDYERKRDQMRTDHLIEELVEELKPWAIGALVLAFFGFCVNLWLGFVKRKTQRASSRVSSSSSSSSSRAGPSSGYSAGTSRSHLETDSGRSSSRKNRSRS